MNFAKGALLVIVTSGLLTGCATFSSGDSNNDSTGRSLETMLTDENLEIKADYSLFKNDEIWKNSEIDVVSFNKTVLLIGQTPTLSLKQKAEQLVKNLPDINRVYNEIRVAAPTGTLTYLSDVSITTKVKTALFGEDDFDSSKIKVVTEDSEVFLLGLVSKKEAEKAIEIARNVSGVKRVIQAFEIVAN